jgi:hypothetical protein
MVSGNGNDDARKPGYGEGCRTGNYPDSSRRTQGTNGKRYSRPPIHVSPKR